MTKLKFYVPQSGPVYIDKSETKIVRMRNGRYAYTATYRKAGGKTVKLFRFAAKSEVEGGRPKRGGRKTYRKRRSSSRGSRRGSRRASRKGSRRASRKGSRRASRKM